MAASYPGTIKTFSTKAPGEAIASSHINDLQNEVVAIETTLGTNAGAWLDWTPTFGAGGSMTYTGITYTARYTIINKICYFYVEADGTIGGTPNWWIQLTLPKYYTHRHAFTANAGATANLSLGFSRTYSGNGNVMIVSKYDKSNWSTGSGYGFAVEGFYEIS